MIKSTKKKKIPIGPKKILIPSSKTRRLKIKLSTLLKEHRTLSISIALLLGLALIILLVSLVSKEKNNGSQEAVPQTAFSKDTIADEMISTDFLYADFLPQNVHFSATKKKIIEKDITVEAFFKQHGLDNFKSREIAVQARTKGLDGFKKKHRIYVLKKENRSKIDDFFIYEIALDKLALITLQPRPKVELRTIPIIVKNNEIAETVESSFFWDTFLKQEGNYQLMPEVLNALQWQIDFFHVNPNDHYKMIVEEKWYNGYKVETGHLLAMYYQQKDKEYYAFRYENDGNTAYYDENGALMKMRFLKSPVEYDIINSSYNPNRMHPIHKEVMPHYGTDYYAKLNDPVFAIGKGTISKAGRTENNGNYVKIKHDEKYESQYLHLTSFGPGIKRRKKVEQGDIIGYAGDTGLAAGVHVCFRFWVDGKQVDHTKEKVFQSTAPSAQVSDLEGFKIYRDSLKTIFDTMVYN